MKYIRHKEMCGLLGIKPHALHRKKHLFKEGEWVKMKSESKSNNGIVMWDLSRLDEIKDALFENETL